MSLGFWINFGLPLSIVAFAALVTWLAVIYFDREQRAIDALVEAEEAAKREAERQA